MAELLEILMVVCFGISWPISIRKSWLSRTAKGKSLVFECFILAGYVFGIASKIASRNISYVLIFYIINLITVSIDVVLYFRNRRLDLARSSAGASSCQLQKAIKGLDPEER